MLHCVAKVASHSKRSEKQNSLPSAGLAALRSAGRGPGLAAALRGRRRHGLAQGAVLGGQASGAEGRGGRNTKKKEHWVLQAPCKDSHQTHEHATRNPCPKLGEPNVFFFVLGFFFCFKARLQRWLEDIGAAVTLGDYRHAREDEDSLDKHFFYKKIYNTARTPARCWPASTRWGRPSAR